MRLRLRMATRLKGKMAELKEIVDQLSKLTVLETADLVKQLEAAWGVTAAAPVAVAAAGGAAAGGAAAEPAAGSVTFYISRLNWDLEWQVFREAGCLPSVVCRKKTGWPVASPLIRNKNAIAN